MCVYVRLFLERKQEENAGQREREREREKGGRRTARSFDRGSCGECEERGEKQRDRKALRGSRGDQTGRLPHVGSGAHLRTPVTPCYTLPCQDE